MRKDNWDLDKAMANVMRSRSHKPSVKPGFTTGSVTVDVETLSTCLTVLAHIIKNDGDQYLPIFERLKNELDEFRRLQSLKDLAINMADQSNFGKNHHQNGELTVSDVPILLKNYLGGLHSGHRSEIRARE